MRDRDAKVGRAVERSRDGLEGEIVNVVRRKSAETQVRVRWSTGGVEWLHLGSIALITPRSHNAPLDADLRPGRLEGLI